MKTKFSLASVVAFAALLVLFGVWFWGSSPRMQAKFEDQAAQEYADKLIADQKADVYGGFTPEETMRLFADAIEKGDIDLAVKYFQLDKQDSALLDLKEMKRNDNFQLLLSDLRSLILERKNSDTAYWVSSITGRDVSVSMSNNSLSGRWKVLEL